MQRGLIPAYYYQIILNGFRLGMYDSIKQKCQELLPKQDLAPMVIAGFTSGVLGAFMASPFFLIKTRMQSFTKSTKSVGYQHEYVDRGVLYSIKHIYRLENISGLFRGVDASMARTGVGSMVQLPSYEIIKRNLSDMLSGTQLHFASSLLTSLLVCLAMNPFDVLMTRMYNQQNANTYSSVLDCFKKTYRTEGVVAFYKGFSAHYLRIG